MIELACLMCMAVPAGFALVGVLIYVLWIAQAPTDDGGGYW